MNHLPLLNYQAVPGSDAADLLYLWGAFPKGRKKPFVVELDNPFVLTYYNSNAFRHRLGAIKHKLRQAHRITFLSSAARNHTLELLGEEFAEKSKVFSPFMERNYLKNKRQNDGIVRFLFVGLGFRRKGGPELLHAFARLPHKNTQLTVIADVGDEVKKMYAHDKRIQFLPPQPRTVLFEDMYPISDIFVFPSLHESLGVVLLEALSFGMGLIATNVYATPDLVEDGINGKLLPHPFLASEVFHGVPTVDCATLPRSEFMHRYLRTEEYESLTGNLLQAMTEAMEFAPAWQEKSIALFEKKFSPECWEQSLQGIIEG